MRFLSHINPKNPCQAVPSLERYPFANHKLYVFMKTDIQPKEKFYVVSFFGHKWNIQVYELVKETQGRIHGNVIESNIAFQ